MEIARKSLIMPNCASLIVIEGARFEFNFKGITKRPQKKKINVERKNKKEYNIV